MSGHYHRAQVLLEPRQVRTLKRLARERSCSVSRLIRELIERGLARVEPPVEEDPLEELAKLRRLVEATSGVYSGDPVAEVRGQAVSDSDQVMGGGRDADR